MFLVYAITNDSDREKNSSWFIFLNFCLSFYDFSVSEYVATRVIINILSEIMKTIFQFHCIRIIIVG